MANVKEVGKTLSTQEQPKSIEMLVRDAGKELSKSLPKHLRAERVVQIALTCIRQVPELAKCTPASFIGALFTSAQIGLEPIAGNAYILPFNNHRKVNGEWKTVKEAQFIIGYKGLINLFYRHEKSVQISVGTVHEKDDFVYEYGTNAYLKHIPASGNRGKSIGFYCIATLTNGGKSFMYMTKEECLEHAKKHSKTYDKKTGEFMPASPYITNEDAMCSKIVISQHSKVLPLSVELQRIIAVDETSREYRAGVGDMLGIPDQTNWNGEEKVEKVEVQVDTSKALEAPKDEAKKKEEPRVRTEEEIETDFVSKEQVTTLNQLVKINLIKEAELSMILENFNVEKIEEVQKENYQDLYKAIKEYAKNKREDK
jgi:recombination protein RecT